MNITWFGHSCIRVDTGTSKLLIDPFLTGNPVFEGSGVSIDEVADDVTHVALTHGHDDHVGDTVAICKATGATLIAVFEIAMYLNGQGVEAVDPTNTGGTVSHSDFDLTFVNATHSSGTFDGPNPVYLGNPCGLVIHAEGKRVYHMGDTDIFSDMGLINEIYSPAVGIVPIGDRFTMGAKTAALACKRFFAFETIIPCHYGTFPIIDPTPDAFIAEMGGQNVVVPKLGQAVEV